MIKDVTPSVLPDDRFLIHGVTFSARCAYSLLSSAHEIYTHADCIWSFKATIKVKIFAWLLFKDRLNTKANLLRKTIIHDFSCPRFKDPVNRDVVMAWRNIPSSRSNF
ncbi:putative LRR receptor-like serine/threonine-protein kinase [Hordeum vulgare]|nr:putative LRR receptor-like serine/threonine-protein kinase [Hordeum vulgare]